MTTFGPVHVQLTQPPVTPEREAEIRATNDKFKKSDAYELSWAVLDVKDLLAEIDRLRVEKNEDVQIRWFFEDKSEELQEKLASYIISLGDIQAAHARLVEAAREAKTWIDDENCWSSFHEYDVGRGSCKECADKNKIIDALRAALKEEA